MTRPAFELRAGPDLHADHCGMLAYLGGLDPAACPFPLDHRQRKCWMLGYYAAQRLYGPKGYLTVPAAIQAEANEFVENHNRECAANARMDEMRSAAE